MENRWMEEYQKAIKDFDLSPNSDNKKRKKVTESKYNHNQVKSALKAMFSSKCAYCESHIMHISYGDIEHYRPKSRFPLLCFNWDNLLLGCGNCNSSAYKGDKFPEINDGGPFVNPVEEDPDDFFDFEFDPQTGTANVVPKNLRGETTEKELGLNRTELVKHRSSLVRKMVAISIKASQGDLNCLSEILSCCDNNDEYVAFAKTLIKRYGLSP